MHVQYISRPVLTTCHHISILCAKDIAGTNLNEISGLIKNQALECLEKCHVNVFLGHFYELKTHERFL